MAYAPEKRTEPRLGLSELFLGFLTISMLGFGGPIVWARRIIVERRRWLDEQEFAEILAFCQFMPGPNVVSIAVCVGERFRGAAGALAGLSGIILAPWALGFTAGVLCLEYAPVPIVQNTLRGISAAASGLIVATGLRLLRPYRARPVALVFVVVAFAGLVFAKLPLVLVVAVLVPLSIAVAWVTPGQPA